MTVQLPLLDARILHWDSQDFVERNCPFCFSPEEKVKYLRPDTLSIRFCKKCHTYFVSPSPSERQLSSFYSTYDEHHRRFSEPSARELLRMYKSLDPFSDLRIRKLSSLVSLKNSKVLDVGFGRSRFLYQIMKLGAVPYGIELDQKSIELARALGIQNISHGTLEDMPEDCKYDVILLNDMIEHPLHPMDLLKKAGRLLEQGGLLVLWTPNGDSAKYEEYPTTFRVDLEHMQYLTADSCIFLATQLNMSVVHLESLGFPSLAGIDSPARHEHNLKTKMKKAIKLIPGYFVLNNLRVKMLASKKEDDRFGRYHLFCIMQKNE